MRIGIPKEIFEGERRVAATPDTAKRLQKLGFEVLVESGAGESASFPDDAYTAVGCTIVDGPTQLYTDADIIAKVRPPGYHPVAGTEEVELMKEGSTLISFIWPAQNEALVEMLQGRKVTSLAMDQVPRISRAQKLDALSSMANIAGYRAVVEAANHFPRFFTGQITAAGKVPPAKVMVIGAGVAGLAAIGAARGLGAIVRAFDTRPAVKEQVESMGAEFLELDFEEDGAGAGGYAKVMSPEFIAAEMALFLEQAQEVDIIITTALIPGRPAPRLITREHVEAMRPGSVVVDLAAEQGGNCELTQPGKVVKHNGVTIVGHTDLPSRLAAVASQLYGTNIAHLLDDMGKAEGYHVDMDDEVVRGALITHEGNKTWPPPKPPEPSPSEAKKAEPAPAPVVVKKGGHGQPKEPGSPVPLLLAGAALLGVGVGAPPSFLSHFTVFVLAIFVGWQIIWNVSPALHTPLMSVTNAISGIIIIGGMLQVSGAPMSATVILGAAAILVATINIAGGFLVTQRMLQMFRK
ncbi:Re/Si-specific NAD(P)(+) transhydrogenase subunit alpha [Paraliomyxa miuraensis]|uniref:Re/Si-specific NAD(P)(+) transhydrogenase subunit alpha n=1 Tax=Paraliomyxa miuraensis TaxID=376150 RepID=UPI002250DF35|nr:Re/Si-specific NAD(P)(+) transhydrogenase subunit alpha [Paraliomyxa miuraensis]MCX4247644.1 Re/Si-specific NAD(P)(+) transhydrogenase subunit alpha [Paraliomyxa miuraensis]